MAELQVGDPAPTFKLPDTYLTAAITKSVATMFTLIGPALVQTDHQAGKANQTTAVEILMYFRLPVEQSADT